MKSSGFNVDRSQPWQWVLTVLIFVIHLSSPMAAEKGGATPITREISLDAETDLQLNIYPANGGFRVLWIPAYATPADTVSVVAKQLTKMNIEVWHADILEARFLPKTASSIYKIRENDIISVINTANKNNGKKLFIFTESRSSIPVLLALREMQLAGQPLDNFGGIILSSPYFFIETPNPGQQAELMPIVSATNLPLYIIQPKNSPRYWQLAQSVPALEKSGSDVFVQVLPNIRGRFLFRPDSTQEEDTLSQKFGPVVAQALKHLETVNHKKRLAVKQKVPSIRSAGGKKDHVLQSYTGDLAPPPLLLENLSGTPTNLKSFAGRVVLVNFWTTWCPPCVKEMPSLQRLSRKIPKNRFVILGVNIAEDRETIRNFISTKVKVDFPVILDIDGDVMRQWNVMAFPTSFVIDKNGKIRYALFGSIEWDTPEITKLIQSLADE